MGNNSSTLNGNGLIIKPRLIVCSQSRPKSGKTHWALTGPDVHVQDIDDGIHRAYPKFDKKKKIEVHAYRQLYNSIRTSNAGEAEVMKMAQGFVRQLEEDYLWGLQNFPLNVMDGHAEVYEMVRLAFFGRTEQVQPHRYAEVNREMKWFIDMARESDSSVVFTHRLKDEYVNNQKTGALEIEGWKKIYYEVDMTVLHWKEQKEPVPQRYHLEVLDCGINPELEGEKFSNVSFDTILKLVFPKTPNSDRSKAKLQEVK